MLNRFVQSSEIVTGSIHGAQGFQEFARLFIGVYLISLGAWRCIVFFIFTRQITKDLVKIGALKKATIENIGLESLEKFEGSSNTNPEGLNARLEAFLNTGS